MNLSNSLPLRLFRITALPLRKYVCGSKGCSNLILRALCSIICGVSMAPAYANEQTPSLHALTAKSLAGKDVPLESYKGKVVVIANTASKCGFTHQYKALQKLFSDYQEKGVVVLGFPSNDFGHQEPGSDDEIKKFCELNYGVSFPMFTKNPVSGEEKQPVFKFLTEGGDESLRGEINWNFEKFLIDKQGRLRYRFSSFTSPTSSKISKKIQELLAE